MSTALKKVTYHGVAAIKDGHPVGVTFVNYVVDGQSGIKRTQKTATCMTPQELVATLFAVGDRVTVVDGEHTSALIGSNLGRRWYGTKVSFVGMTGTVTSIDADGDVWVDFREGGHTYFAPDFLRKAPAMPVFKIDDTVVCEQVWPGGPGWQIGMTARCGCPGKVKDIDGSNAMVGFSDGVSYVYSTDWLRLATDKEIEALHLLNRALEAFKDTNVDAHAVSTIVKSTLGKRAHESDSEE